MALKKGGLQKRGLIEEQGSQKSLQYVCLPRGGNCKVTLVYLTTQKLVLIKYTLNGISNSSVTGTHTHLYICLFDCEQLPAQQEKIWL